MPSRSPNGAPAILVDGLSKRFEIPRERRHTLKERALHPLRKPGHDRLEALREVSFEIAAGEFFGIVGRNGSGKSTLLKCLAGIYRADAGDIYVDGRLSAFIELGVGFNMELAARDNVIMNGIMLGLSPSEARARVDAVVEFAELEEFVDLKLKNYSSGMQVRLAFAVMIQVQADVLLIDEVLAVGDVAFQQKCHDVFHRLRDEGRTVVLVTHDMAAVERFCDRAILLEHGRVDTVGDAQTVTARYLQLAFRSESREAYFPTQQPRGGDGRARVLEAWLEDAGGVRSDSVLQGERCVVRARVRFEAALEDPSFALSWVNASNQNHFVVSTAVENLHTGRFTAGDEAVFAVAFDNVLAPGRYHLSLVVAARGTGEQLLDRWERALSVVVAAAHTAGGLVDLPHEVSVERVIAPDSEPTASVG
ncbi:MAG TPA: ABC transporter ATP-binding protein [Solirubrobacteraceae bacterium]